MRALKSLQQEIPVLSDDFLEFCASRGIFSLEDFLVRDIYALVGFAECHASSADIKQGIAQVLSIIDKQHEPWLNAMELLEDQQNKHVLSTGLDGIDSLIEGGLSEGRVIELVGASSSGKTQVCLAAASNVAHKNACTVAYLDTCNSFSSKRIANYVNSALKPLSKEDRMQCLKTVMNNIVCRSVLDILDLWEVLHELGSTLTHQLKSQCVKMRLLIIDSVSSLISPILGGKSSYGRSIMISIGYLLKKLAIKCNIAVLVTNHMVAGERDTLKPALGESWKSVPHVRLLLSREPATNTCTMRLGGPQDSLFLMGEASNRTLPNVKLFDTICSESRNWCYEDGASCHTCVSTNSVENPSSG